MEYIFIRKDILKNILLNYKKYILFYYPTPFRLKKKMGLILKFCPNHRCSHSLALPTETSMGVTHNWPFMPFDFFVSLPLLLDFSYPQRGRLIGWTSPPGRWQYLEARGTFSPAFFKRPLFLLDDWGDHLGHKKMHFGLLIGWSMLTGYW